MLLQVLRCRLPERVFGSAPVAGGVHVAAHSLRRGGRAAAAEGRGMQERGRSCEPPPFRRLSEVKSGRKNAVAARPRCISGDRTAPPAPRELGSTIGRGGGSRVAVRPRIPRKGLPRKEVIQPHLPVQLPCYDFVPVTSPALGAGLLAVSCATSGVTSFHDVTGGVYKARERIHRSRADLRLLATPSSCRRVAACNPNWGKV